MSAWMGALAPLAKGIKGFIEKKKSDNSGAGPTKKHPDGGSDSEMASFKKGGKVKKTGPAYLHKGERVLNTKQARKYKGGKRG